MPCATGEDRLPDLVVILNRVGQLKLVVVAYLASKDARQVFSHGL